MKRIVEFVSIILTFYLGIFFLWFLLAGACATSISEGTSCGDDAMTRTISITHRPIINLIK